jgi:SAM-dependent methyltransferase
MGDDFRESVRSRYADAARSVQNGGGCCGPDGCGVDLTAGSYAGEELDALPEGAVGASLGCGNPVALAELSPGQVVLDLGSGGGIDVLLSARRVSPGGKAYGMDMTDEMLDLARSNQREAGVENVEFLKGQIEAIPLPAEHVDVVISNCVINLSTEKEKVFDEALRVLRPGGMIAVSDMVFLGDKSRLPENVVRRAELWAGCVSGALERREYEAMLSEAGFVNISVEVTNVYPPESVGLEGSSDNLDEVPLASAFVRAKKPDRNAEE